jgi:hypothetical protein
MFGLSSSCVSFDNGGIVNGGIDNGGNVSICKINY